jgi:penicillin-binding protein 1A
MSRVTGGSFPAQTWHEFLVQARDTDNIPQIPGIPLHPVQVAEQERLAQLQKAAAAEAGGDAAAAPVIAAPTPESVKDMSGTTRQILERIGDMLKKAPALNPSDTKPESRAEAPAAKPIETPSNVASAAAPPAPAVIQLGSSPQHPVATSTATSPPP